MIIEVLSVSNPRVLTSVTGREYKIIEVIYKNDEGHVDAKKLVSFADPYLFRKATEWTEGQEVEVETKTNKRGFDEWTLIHFNKE